MKLLYSKYSLHAADIQGTERLYGDCVLLPFLTICPWGVTVGYCRADVIVTTRQCTPCYSFSHQVKTNGETQIISFGQ